MFDETVWKSVLFDDLKTLNISFEYVGLHLLKRSLKSTLSIRFSFHLLTSFSLGKVCGSQKSILRIAFFLWTTSFEKVLTTNNI